MLTIVALLVGLGVGLWIREQKVVVNVSPSINIPAVHIPAIVLGGEKPKNPDPLLIPGPVHFSKPTFCNKCGDYFSSLWVYSDGSRKCSRCK